MLRHLRLQHPQHPPDPKDHMDHPYHPKKVLELVYKWSSIPQPKQHRGKSDPFYIRMLVLRVKLLSMKN